jgi:hypothetical protein
MYLQPRRGVLIHPAAQTHIQINFTRDARKTHTHLNLSRQLQRPCHKNVYVHSGTEPAKLPSAKHRKRTPAGNKTTLTQRANADIERLYRKDPAVHSDTHCTDRPPYFECALHTQSDPLQGHKPKHNPTHSTHNSSTLQLPSTDTQGMNGPEHQKHPTPRRQHVPATATSPHTTNSHGVVPTPQDGLPPCWRAHTSCRLAHCAS